jgi:hypothetical protein
MREIDFFGNEHSPHGAMLPNRSRVTLLEKSLS